MQTPGESSTGSLPEAFGKYTLLANIATGGMGEVLLARLSAEAGFEKLVVIKRILPHLTDKQNFVKMFLDEARTVARLHHPNVCQTYELGQVKGQYYMAMEYLEGVTLKEVIRSRVRWPKLREPPFLCGLLVQACEGLHYAHDLRQPDGSLAQLVHRDVNPRNIFVTSAGAAKMLDFGIAKSRASLNETRAGAVKGTYAYMSPEQLRGGVTLDRRSDIFSLGVVTWEALTGTRLFKRDTDYKTFHAIVRDPIPRVRDVDPSIPQALDDAVSRALARDREKRFETAREYALALERGVQAYGAPLTSLAIAAEVERAFEPEFERQRSLLLAAHRSVEEDEADEFQVPTTIFTGSQSPILPQEKEEAGKKAADEEEEVWVDIEEEPPQEQRLGPQGATAVLTHRPGTPPPLPGLPPIAGSKPTGPAALERASSANAYTPPPQTIPGMRGLSTGSEGAARPQSGDEDTGSAEHSSTESSYSESSSGSGVVGELGVRPRMGRALFVVGVVAVGVTAFLLASHLTGPSSAPQAGLSGADAAVRAAAPPDRQLEEDAGTKSATATAGSGKPADAGVKAHQEAPIDAALARAKPPDAAPRSGRLEVTSTPRAAVFIDGHRVGLTPLTDHELEVGAHTLRLVARGKPARELRIRIRAGKTVKRSVSWPTQPPRPRGSGYLTLDSKPYATAFIDGKKLGFTPIVHRKLSAGVHSIRLVSSKGGGQKRFRVRIKADQTVRRVVTW